MFDTPNISQASAHADPIEAAFASDEAALTDPTAAAGSSAARAAGGTAPNAGGSATSAAADAAPDAQDPAGVRFASPVVTATVPPDMGTATGGRGKGRGRAARPTGSLSDSAEADDGPTAAQSLQFWSNWDTPLLATWLMDYIRQTRGATPLTYEQRFDRQYLLDRLVRHRTKYAQPREGGELDNLQLVWRQFDTVGGEAPGLYLPAAAAAQETVDLTQLRGATDMDIDDGRDTGAGAGAPAAIAPHTPERRTQERTGNTTPRSSAASSPPASARHAGAKRNRQPSPTPQLVVKRGRSTIIASELPSGFGMDEFGDDDGSDDEDEQPEQAAAATRSAAQTTAAAATPRPVISDRVRIPQFPTECCTCLTARPPGKLGPWICEGRLPVAEGESETCGLRGDVDADHPANQALMRRRDNVIKAKATPASSVSSQSTTSDSATLAAGKPKLDRHFDARRVEGRAHPLFTPTFTDERDTTPAALVDAAFAAGQATIGAPSFRAPSAELIAFIQSGKFDGVGWAIPRGARNPNQPEEAGIFIAVDGKQSANRVSLEPPGLTNITQFFDALVSTILPALIAQPRAVMQWLALARSVITLSRRYHTFAPVNTYIDDALRAAVQQRVDIGALCHLAAEALPVRDNAPTTPGRSDRKKGGGTAPAQTARHSSSASHAASSSTARTGQYNGPLCRRFNTNGCTDSTCHRPHKCILCNGAHAQTECPRNGGASSVTTAEK